MNAEAEILAAVTTRAQALADAAPPLSDAQARLWARLAGAHARDTEADGAART